MPTIHVATEPAYDIHIGQGLLDRCGELTAAAHAPCRVLVLCDTHVAPLYAQRAEASFARAGFATVRFVFPAGEESKNLTTLGEILNFLGEEGFTRTDLVAALGGGVCGDMGGFAAAVFQRGIDFVQIPTTLLAAVDSSVGGKTAVDLPCGKNMAGCFWQPRAVICDPDVFATLPPEVFACGMAETIKTGAILDRALFEKLESCDINDEIESVVARCCELKRTVVEADERDFGLRQLLNFGHTIGHGIERSMNFQLPHGFAVAIGMVLMARSAEGQGLAEAGITERLIAILRRYDLPTATDLPAATLCEGSHMDKKRAGKGITIVVSEKLGAAVRRKMTLEELDQWIERGAAE